MRVPSASPQLKFGRDDELILSGRGRRVHGRSIRWIEGSPKFWQANKPFVLSMNAPSHHRRNKFAWIAGLVFFVCGVAVNVANANDYYVHPTGVGGAFTRLQAAINAVPAGSLANRTNIFIVPGTCGDDGFRPPI